MKPGDTYIGEFTTWVSASGLAVDADSLPTATISRNGVDDGTVVATVVDKGVGRYKVTAVIPTTYSIGDFIAVTIFYTVGGVAMSSVIDMFQLDNTRDLLQALLNPVPTDTVTYYGYSVYPDGTPVAGRTVNISLVSGPQSSGNAMIETVFSGIETDRLGRWQANLARGKQFQIRIPEEGISTTVTVPVDTNITTINIKDVLT